MIESRQRYQHFYNASAMALGGKLTRPFEAIVETQAASVLPIDGGFGSARVENFRFKEMISFKSAYSVVTGSQSKVDGSFATLATVTIEDLNILEMVTAKRIVSRISTHHPIPRVDAGATSLPASPEPQILATGKFEELRINGYEFDVELDANLSSDCSTYSAYKDKCGVPENKGMIVRSLVKNIYKKSPGVAPELLKPVANAQNQSCRDVRPILPSAENRFVCTFELAQYGRIHLAQFLCSSYARRLVMLRVELGCPADGILSVGCGQGNGTTIP